MWEYLVQGSTLRIQHSISSPSDLLLSEIQRVEGDSLNGHDLESHTWDITNSVTLTTETADEDLIVVVDIVKATIPGHEGGDLLAVLLEEHSHALTHTGVRLLALDTDLLDNEALGLGGTIEHVLPSGVQEPLLPEFTGPSNKELLKKLHGVLIYLARSLKLSSCEQSSWFSNTHALCSIKICCILNL